MHSSAVFFVRHPLRHELAFTSKCHFELATTTMFHVACHWKFLAEEGRMGVMDPDRPVIAGIICSRLQAVWRMRGGGGKRRHRLKPELQTWGQCGDCGVWILLGLRLLI